MKGSYFLLLICSFSAFSQVSSEHERFSVPYNKGCVPFTVNLSENDNFGNIARTYTYELGSSETLDTFYTYTQPGIYEIIQLVGVDVTPKFDTLKIEVFDPVPPSFNYYFCDDSNIAIEITDSIYDLYDVETPFGFFRINQDDQKLIILSLPDTNEVTINITGLFLDAFQNCGMSTKQIALRGLQHNISILNYKFEYVCDNEVSLNLEYLADPYSLYEIEYTTNNIEFERLHLGSLVDTTLLLSGLFIDQFTSQICFRINTVSQCGDQKIEGILLCQEIDNNLTSFDKAYASYTENEDIALIFNENRNGNYSAVKYVDADEFKTFFDIKSGYIDEFIYPLRQYHYKLIFLPSCLADEQTVTLSAGKISSKDKAVNSFEINWIEPEFLLSTDLIYQIVIANEDQTEKRVVENINHPQSINIDHRLGINQKVWVEGFSSDEGIVIRSNSLNLEYKYFVHLPEAFTPNGDGINDYLEIFGLPNDKFELFVFNKWGEVVFFTNDKSELWDGKRRNGEVSAGQYAYKIDFLNNQGKMYTQRGSFTLIK